MPVLWHVVHRLQHAKNIDDIVVATTGLKEDDVIASFCLKSNIHYFRGDSEDVLSRYYVAAKKSKAEIIIRITSDCPMIDPEIVDKIIACFEANQSPGKKIDYCSNTIERTYPRGFDTEVFSFKALSAAYHKAKDYFEREHVTPYIYQNPGQFSIKSFRSPKNYSHLRLTLDTSEDYQLLKKIYDQLYSRTKLFLFKDIKKLSKKEPELFEINKNVVQKGR